MRRRKWGRRRRRYWPVPRRRRSYRPRRSRDRLLAVAVAIVALVACDSGEDPGISLPTPVGRPTSADTLVIGLVGTLSGPNAWRGEDAFEGADLAVHELNLLRKEDEPPFELETFDDRGSAERALRHVRELVSLARTVGIVYAGPPEALVEAEGALAKRGVPALFVFGDLYGAHRLSQHVFQMSPSLVWEARRIAAYIHRDRRYETTGILASRTGTGRTAVRSLQAELRRAGARRAKVALYDDVGPRSAIQSLRRAQVEALVVEGSPRDIESAFAAVPAYGNTDAARVASAPPELRRIRRQSGWWAPQVILFDQAMSPRIERPSSAGTVVAESYGRGAHYLPIPSLERFRKAFMAWWGARPLGWQQRSYDAVRMLGWAYGHADPGEDLATSLERIRGVRFGGLDITLGPDDHTAVDQGSVGLWVVPEPGRPIAELDRLPDHVFEALPWVPLARGFSIDGEELDIDQRDWRYLVRGAPPLGAPPPKLTKLRFGVATGRSDPIH